MGQNLVQAQGFLPIPRSPTVTTPLGLSLVAIAADKSLDQSFYNNAAQGGMAEVQLGQMAEHKGQSVAVKDYGKMMVQDHTAANNKLKSIAAGKGVELPDNFEVTLSGRGLAEGFYLTQLALPNTASAAHGRPQKQLTRELESG